MKGILCFATCVLLFSTSIAFSSGQSVKQAVAGWTSSPPVIDGKLDDAAWAGAQELGGFGIISTTGKKAEAQTYVKVLTDGKSLFVGFRCVEPRMDHLKAEKRNRDGEPWLDDSVEVIIDPANSREKLYHLIANAVGSIYDAVVNSPKTNALNDDSAWNGDWEVATSRGSGEWYAEWRIPFKAIGVSIENAPCIGLNLARARCGAKVELSSWSPGVGIFANPARLGELILPTANGLSCSAVMPKLQMIARGEQTINFEVANHSAKPIQGRYVYRLSGPRESWGTSDPFTISAASRQRLQLPINPTETGAYRLSLRIEEAATGRAVYECARSFDVMPELQIEESLYELYQKKASAQITVNILPSELTSKVLKVRLLKESSESPVAEKTMRPPFANPVAVSFDLSAQPKATYLLQADIAAGNEIVTSVQSRPMPYNPRPEIGFDKHGFLVVEGKPYFPVGIYTLQDRGSEHDKVLAEARSAGFNTTVFYAYTPSTVKPLLDAAARQGIKAFVYPTIPFSVRTSTVTNEDVVKDVLVRRDHPALLGWYLVDEPEGIGKAGADPVRDLYQTVKETDTDHPCSLVIMSPKAAGDYSRCADVIWIDPYPVPSRPVTYVSDCTGGAAQAVPKVKPVWTIPQAFDWSIWRTGKVDKVHRPTPEEERCMTYLALVHGAKGIIYWAHTGSRYYIEDYPEHWAAVKKLAGEMRDLTPALLTPDSKQKVEVTPMDATIDTMVKTAGGCVYVFAVNRELDPCKAAFRLPGMNMSKIEVLFEGRTHQAAGGVWNDDFKPLEVHVYRLTAR